jgi:Proto-chlorophyllide reductase 57 kD subunit
MKFLCVLCDQPMKLVEVAPPDRGALSVVYECPECAHRIAMLTNPLETQMVQSLGVQIGPGGEKTESKCPFSAMLPGAAGEPASSVPSEMQWSGQALERLGRVPEFVRPMARSGIERFARENGFREVDEQVLDRAKSFFGM